MESVGKDEIEKKWSGALVGRVSEVGTSDKIPTKVPTISVCSEGWERSNGLAHGPRHTGKPGRSARDSAEPDLLEVGERERSECDMVYRNGSHWVKIG